MKTVKEIRSIGIIGGGTAGYLTALAMKKLRPELSVTLIESDHIPIIGVGEATTPILLKFLHEELNFDVTEFYKEVQPTHKLGIRFEWGLPGNYHFNFPFGKQDAYGSYYINHNISKGSLPSILMDEGKSFIYKEKGALKEIDWISKKPDYAYHLENSRFIDYLKRKAIETGVNHYYDEIKRVDKNELGQIEFIENQNSKTYSFDFYFDCSGFRSLLIGKTFQTPFVSYADSLFTDRALVSSISNNHVIKPYTTASTMNHGWLWNTPLPEEDHIGYVYSSKFCSDEEASRELKQKHPEVTDIRSVKFRSGRHEKVLVGNVMGIGNAFAFVEPLESTGIHMIVASLQIFLDQLNNGNLSAQSIDKINQKVNQKWDHLKEFLALHFKYNKRLDTPFWRACHEQINIANYQNFVDIYKSNGPLRKAENIDNSKISNLLESSIFGLNGIDTFFIGQGEFPDRKDEAYLKERIIKLKQKTMLWEKIAEKALPHKKALELITKGELLTNSSN